MSSRFQLQGEMIPRTVKRMFDQRGEQRLDAGTHSVALSLRGRNHLVQLINLSRSGAMVRFAGDAHIGETVSLQLLDRGTIAGQVRWLRDGRMGVSFVRPLD
ncbi:MAG: PilZ domain-containing protein [Sphingomonas sp.]|uniref:PilZ domain-containing protein n=1 Tax=Sphingomonas sp. TaxID=28214 RepID=UPI00185AC174|nr:PilZ domain-containing protein [Sphingomonas sp.]MBA3667959.1 PilZ domain-containing protein [Sphingomonas sp.]